MRSAVTRSPARHVVVVDTNILWCHDKAVPVHPDFTDFWTNHSSLLPMELIIPYVVRGELLFQQVTSATKHLERVTESLSSISAITEETHTHKLTRERIAAQVA